MWSEPIFNHFSIYLHPSTINETHGIHPCPLYIKLFHICSMLFLYHMEVFISTHIIPHIQLYGILYLSTYVPPPHHTHRHKSYTCFSLEHTSFFVLLLSHPSLFIYIYLEREIVWVCVTVCVCVSYFGQLYLLFKI